MRGNVKTTKSLSFKGDAMMQLADIRKLYAGLSKDLTVDQLNYIPEGFANNILWNLGHVIVTQQMLTYGLAGLALNVPKEMVPMFRKGSSPKMWESPPDAEKIKTLLLELPETFESDYEAGKFESFKTYQTATGPVLKTIDDGIAFNDFHEGLHLGTILALRKLVL